MPDSQTSPPLESSFLSPFAVNVTTDVVVYGKKRLIKILYIRIDRSNETPYSFLVIDITYYLLTVSILLLPIVTCLFTNYFSILIIAKHSFFGRLNFHKYQSKYYQLLSLKFHRKQQYLVLYYFVNIQYHLFEY